MGLAWCARALVGSRYWNAFGLSDNTPKQNSLLPIVCEINPPLEGLNRRVQGAFVKTEDEQLLLVHRGKIGGGRRDIGRPLFFNNYQGQIRDINGRMFAIIGDISSPNLAQKVEFFMKEVDRIKSLV